MGDPSAPTISGVSDTLETPRLLLAQWSEADTALLARLSADARVVQYIGDGQPWRAERAAEVSRTVLEHWHAHGFGWRVALERESGEPIGFAALNYLGKGAAGLDVDELEIGWWLASDAWGRGLASESARAISQEAFTRARAQSVVARIQPENQASARVARRIGMSFEVEATGRFGEPIAVYRLLGS